MVISPSLNSGFFLLLSSFFFLLDTRAGRRSRKGWERRAGSPAPQIRQKIDEELVPLQYDTKTYYYGDPGPGKDGENPYDTTQLFLFFLLFSSFFSHHPSVSGISQRVKVILIMICRLLYFFFSSFSFSFLNCWGWVGGL